MAESINRGPEPAPEPEHPDQIPDGRDPRPENDFPSQPSGSPKLDGFPNRLPLTAVRYFALISFTNVSCGACLLVFQPPGSAV